MKTLKLLLMGTLVMAAAGLAHASVIYTLSINLGNVHAGSTLSGSVTVANALLPGDSAIIALTASDPADYTFVSDLSSTTLTAGNGGAPNSIAFRFSEIIFKNNPSTQNLFLNAQVGAQCFDTAATPNGVPCSATGQWKINDPPRFTGQYTVTAELTRGTVPEPATYGMMLLGAGSLLAFKKRWARG